MALSRNPLLGFERRKWNKAHHDMCCACHAVIDDWVIMRVCHQARIMENKQSRTYIVQKQTNSE